jgi:hypothetical protein
MIELTADVKQDCQVSERWPSISEIITQNTIFVQERELLHFPAPLRQWLEIFKEIISSARSNKMASKRSWLDTVCGGGRRTR